MPLPRLILMAGLAAWLLPAAAAASSRVVSDEALARSSAAAVHGRVVDVASAWDAAAGTIYTYVTLDVLQSWGLSGAPARVVVKQLGGAVGETAFVVGGQARFEVGEETLVFLDVRPRDGTLSVAGLEHGKWIAAGAAADGLAMAREIRGTDPTTVVARDSRSLRDLLDLAALAGSTASAAGANLTPAPDAGAAARADRGVAAFTLLSPGTPARWHQADSGAPVYVDSQSGGHPQITGGGLAQLIGAAALWSGPGSLRLQPGVQRSARCFDNSEPSDGRISVTYGDPCGEIADGSSTLAIGGAYYSSSEVRTVNGVSYWKITKGMIVTDNPSAKFSWMSTGCYEELLAHEIGHAIGFGHAAARPALMYPAISSSCSSRAMSLPLQADELAGMAAVYPASTTAAPGVPVGLGSSVSGSTVTITWNAAASGGAATSYQLRAGSAPGLSNYGAINSTGRSIVVPGVPNGVYYVRVVALNAAGTSAATSDHMVRVGPMAPGAPTNLTASSPVSGRVTIAWQPPASGGAPTSYVLLAGYAPGASTFQIPITGTMLDASGIPAATYYVRVVARNAAGVSAASNEVALVVH